MAPGGPPTAELFSFGPFTLDVYAGSLSVRDLAVGLQPKAFDLLAYFVRNGGRAIAAADLVAAAWADDELSPAGIDGQVTLLREALARYAPRETFIVSESGGGYRFVAAITPLDAAVREDDETARLTQRARYFYDRRTADALDRSIHYYRQAIERNAAYAPAHAGLAAAYALAGEFMLLRPTEAYPRAGVAARDALALDAQSPGAHVVLGHVASHFDRDYAEADRHYARGVALAPASAATLVPQARFWCLVGRTADAAAALRHGLEAEPYSLILQTTLAVTAIFERDFEHAIAQLRRVLERDPDFAHARFYHAVALQLAGRDADVLAETQRRLPDGYEQQYLALRGSALARLRRPDEARPLDAALRSLATRGRFVSCFNLAWFAIGSGDDDHAIGLLEAGFSERDPWLVYLPRYPLFDPLRGDSRFAALVTRALRAATR
jgi:serine/threonine-protein kinase